jgi:phage terminase large subunit GpA-like protein
MDTACDPRSPNVVVMKSAQVGWTEALNNTVGFHVHRDPAPIMVVQPTLELAERWSKMRLAPMIRDTPCLLDRIADAKSRDSGNTLLQKNFRGGSLTVVGANAPAGLRSSSIRVLLFDEVDAYPNSAGAEGDPIGLAMNRTKTFRNRKILMGSTPTVKGVSRIEKAFLESDQRYYFVPCPHCQEFQRLVWAQVKWDDGKPETAAYVCQSCGAMLTDADKPAMLQKGEWRPTASSGVAGFHISELYSPWSTWVEMASKFLVEKKLPETLKGFVNGALGETWEEDGSTVEPGSLLERRDCSPDLLPAGVLMLTIGGDVQNDRVELQLLGWGADEECWILEQHVVRGDPDKADLWRDVDDYLLRRYTTEDGRDIAADAVAIDSGGLSTQSVYQFVVTRKRRRVWAVKGMAGTGRLAWPKKASRTPKSRAMVFIVGVDTIKSTLYGRLGKIADPGPGYIHLPMSADESFCTGLTSEKAFTKYVRGRPAIVWEPRAKGIVQEPQDCWVYGYAAMLGRGGPAVLSAMGRRAKARRPVEPAQEVEASERPVTPQPKPADPPPVRKPFVNARRSGWVRRW